jgi:hypothetical protein
MARFLFAAAILFSFSQSASAYLDPGTGSMILQGIIAGIAVAGFTLKNYWYKILGIFGRGGSASLLEEEEDPQRTE